MVAETTDVRQLNAAQAVLLPALLGATLEQTATLLGSDEPRCTASSSSFAKASKRRPPRARNGVADGEGC